MNISAYVILGTVVLLLAYDLVAVALGWMTLSRTVWELSILYPAVPFAAGFLCGHLFAQMSGVTLP